MPQYFTPFIVGELFHCMCMRAKSLQLRLTLYNPTDHSLPGSSLFMGFSINNTGVDLPNLGIEPVSLGLPNWEESSFPLAPPGKPISLYVKVYVKVLTIWFNSLQCYGLQPTRLLCPWNFPGKYTGVGSYSLLQGIFPTQGWNPGLLPCRQILYHLSHQGSPFHCIDTDFVYPLVSWWTFGLSPLFACYEHCYQEQAFAWTYVFISVGYTPREWSC